MLLPEKGGGRRLVITHQQVFFCNAPILAVWLNKGPKQSVYSLQTPNFKLISTKLILYISFLTSYLLKPVLSAILVVLLKFYPQFFKASQAFKYLSSERWSCQYGWLNFPCLPNFILLQDALTNIYLGLRKSKDGDKAEPLPFKKNIYNFSQEVGQQLVRRDVITATFGFCARSLSFSDEVFKQEIHKSEMYVFS